jgi:MinD-like ATPase involved in chromosome partitioning or flagellar assembly
VDGDERAGALPLLLGAAPPWFLGDLRGGALAPHELLVRLGDRLALLPGERVAILPGGASPDTDGAASRDAADDPWGAAAPMSPAERRALARRATELYEEADVVVVDAGSMLDAVAAHAGGTLGASASRVLAIAADEPVALAATYALIKALGARAPGAPVEVLVNRCGEQEGARAFERIEAAARHFLGHAATFRGVVPDDPCLTAGMRAAMPIQDASHDGAAARAIREITRRLIPAATAAR